MFRLTKKNAPKRKVILAQESDSGSDSDGPSFALEMEQRARKVSKLAREAEDAYVQEPEIEHKPKKSNANVVENLYKAKARRDKDREEARLLIEEQELKQYLEQHQEAVVFNSEGYLKLRVDKIAEEEEMSNEAEITGSGFYAGLLHIRTGRDMDYSMNEDGKKQSALTEIKSSVINTDTATDKAPKELPRQMEMKNQPNEESRDIDQKLTIHHRNLNLETHDGTSYYSKLRERVMDFMKLRLTKTDIDEARERYYRRCQEKLTE